MRILQLYAGTMREEIAAAAPRQGCARPASRPCISPGPAARRPAVRIISACTDPRRCIEYDNTQDSANHVHSVWIDPQGIFGRDLLKAHYRGAH